MGGRKKGREEGRDGGKEERGEKEGWTREVSPSQTSLFLLQSPCGLYSSSDPPSLHPWVVKAHRGLTTREHVGRVQCEVRIMAQTGVTMGAQTAAEAQGQPELGNGPPALPGGAFPVSWGSRCWLLQEPSIVLTTRALTIPSPGPHPPL